MSLPYLPALLLLACLAALTGCESISTAPPPKPAPAAPPKPPPLPARADRVVLEKSKRLLSIYSHNKVAVTYKVALGRNPVGAKTCSGDYRTPEGHYTITGKNPESRFHRSLRLSYPNPTDVARARKQHCDPGGNVAIHGLENGYGWVGQTHSSADWTNGCIAVTDQQMDQLWQMMPIGTPVEIRP